MLHLIFASVLFLYFYFNPCQIQTLPRLDERQDTFKAPISAAYGLKKLEMYEWYCHAACICIHHVHIYVTYTYKYHITMYNHYTYEYVLPITYRFLNFGVVDDFVVDVLSMEENVKRARARRLDNVLIAQRQIANDRDVHVRSFIIFFKGCLLFCLSVTK